MLNELGVLNLLNESVENHLRLLQNDSLLYVKTEGEINGYLKVLNNKEISKILRRTDLDCCNEFLKYYKENITDVE